MGSNEARVPPHEKSHGRYGDTPTATIISLSASTPPLHFSGQERTLEDMRTHYHGNIKKCLLPIDIGEKAYKIKPERRKQWRQIMTSRLANKFREANRLQHILLKLDRTPAEEQEFAEIMSAQLMADAKRFARHAPDEARNLRIKAWELRGQMRLTGTITPTARLLRRIHRMPRARRTAPATAARAADSGGPGSGDPEPEPPAAAPFDFAHLASLLNYPSTLVASQAMPGVCS